MDITMEQEDCITKENSELVLERDPETDEPLVTLEESLGDVLKPHQVSGIKFMYASTVGSISKLEDGDEGKGCILAHCMGLGKTLQSVALIDALLSNLKCSKHIGRVLICCPKTTIHNWKSEFDRWIPKKRIDYQVIELMTTTDIRLREKKLEDWYEKGGVCIIGYNMYRLLANNTKYSIFQKSLLSPGPDLIICDEGHIVKNEKSAISKTLSNLSTRRRVTLSGTPMQNNLLEYHCMVNFVQPDMMGTKKDFIKKFVKPIDAGQCANATKWEVTKMKKRAHVLHKKLQGCIQRMDYSVLRPYLQAKHEYVIYIQMSKIQDLLYRYYLENLAQGQPGVNNVGQTKKRSGLFVDHAHLSRVWTHPLMFLLSSKNLNAKSSTVQLDQSSGDISEEHYLSDDGQKRKQITSLRRAKKFRKKSDMNDNYMNEDNSHENSCNSSDDESSPLVIDDTPEINQHEENILDNKENEFEMTNDELVPRDWWKSVMRENDLDHNDPNFMHQIEHSGKLLLLLDILRECTLRGEKLLVFSQSLVVLDTIEKLLSLIDCGALNLPDDHESSRQQLRFTEWKKETAGTPVRDFMRLDGSTPAEERKILCKSFNDKQNERCRLFLISTRAGGLGINLVAANRVIIFDSSWNPANDIQSIFRVYRFGQSKPCYIYRFVAQGTMEEKIYSRQITKTSTSLRVIDHHQVKRHYNMAELSELYKYTPADVDKREIYHLPEDHLLAELLRRQKKWIVDYHEQDSLLENIENEDLSEDERKAAWEEYEKDREEKETAVEIVPASLPPLIALESDGEEEVHIIKHYKDQSIEEFKNMYLQEDYHQFDSIFEKQMCGGTFMEAQKPFNGNLSNQVYNNHNFSENTLERSFYSNTYNPSSSVYDPLLGNEYSDLMQTSPINYADCAKNSAYSEQFTFDSHKSLGPLYENDPFRISSKETNSWENRVWESRPSYLDYRAPSKMSSEDEKDPHGLEDGGYKNNRSQLECDTYSVDTNSYEWISEPNSPAVSGEKYEFDMESLLNN